MSGEHIWARVGGMLIKYDGNESPTHQVTYQGRESEQSSVELLCDSLSVELERSFEGSPGVSHSHDPKITVPEFGEAVLNNESDESEIESDDEDTRTIVPRTERFPKLAGEGKVHPPDHAPVYAELDGDSNRGHFTIHVGRIATGEPIIETNSTLEEARPLQPAKLKRVPRFRHPQLIGQLIQKVEKWKARERRHSREIFSLQAQVIISDEKCRKLEYENEMLQMEKLSRDTLLEARVEKSQDEMRQLRPMFRERKEEDPMGPFLTSAAKNKESDVNHSQNQLPLGQTQGFSTASIVDFQEIGFEVPDTEQGWRLPIQERLLEVIGSPDVSMLPVSDCTDEVQIPLGQNNQDACVPLAPGLPGKQQKSVMESDQGNKPRGKIKKRTVKKAYFRWTNEKNIKLINAMIEELAEIQEERETESIFLNRVWERSGRFFPLSKLRDHTNNVLNRYLHESQYNSAADVKADLNEYKRLLQVIRTKLCESEGSL